MLAGHASSTTSSLQASAAASIGLKCWKRPMGAASAPWPSVGSSWIATCCHPTFVSVTFPQCNRCLQDLQRWHSVGSSFGVICSFAAQERPNRPSTSRATAAARRSRWSPRPPLSQQRSSKVPKRSFTLRRVTSSRTYSG